MRTLIIILTILLFSGSLYSKKKPILRHHRKQMISGCYELKQRIGSHKKYIVIGKTEYQLNKSDRFKKGDNVFLKGEVTTRQLTGKSQIIHIKKIEICECCSVGIKGDLDKSGTVDISDLVWMVDYYYTNGEEPICLESCDINGDDIFNEDDVFAFVEFMKGGPYPVRCE